MRGLVNVLFDYPNPASHKWQQGLQDFLKDPHMTSFQRWLMIINLCINEPSMEITTDLSVYKLCLNSF